jgi:hypothetical protein
MQDGDLGTWDKPRILLVLEDCLTRPVFRSQRHGLKHVTVLMDADDWDWAITTVKTIMRYSYNSVPCEVITFLSQEAADEAAGWFGRYDIEVASVEYYSYAHFTRSLTWRRNGIQEIIDTNPERVHNYGQLGRLILWDSEF